jgi:hypothetical protein
MRKEDANIIADEEIYDCFELKFLNDKVYIVNMEGMPYVPIKPIITNLKRQVSGRGLRLDWNDDSGYKNTVEQYDGKFLDIIFTKYDEEAKKLCMDEDSCMTLCIPLSLYPKWVNNLTVSEDDLPDQVYNSGLSMYYINEYKSTLYARLLDKWSSINLIGSVLVWVMCAISVVGLLAIIRFIF